MTRRFTVTVEPIDTAGWCRIPPVKRLARLCKAAARGYGLKVTSLAPEPESPRRVFPTREGLR